MRGKLYPSSELRNKLVKLGIPRYKHNLAELGEHLKHIDYLLIHKAYIEISKKYPKEYSKYGRRINCAFVHSFDPNFLAKMLIYLTKNKLI